MIPTSHFHPMLVHFPIALVTIGFGVELASIFIKKEVCLPKVSFYLLIIGTLAGIFTWLSGSLFTGEMSGGAGEIKETHELFATVTVCLLLVTSILQCFLQIRHSINKKLQWLGFVLYALATVSVTITGSYGGILVYNYMMPH
jgi:uncharacterized membrane protein